MVVTFSMAQDTDTIFYMKGVVKSIGARNELNKRCGEWLTYYENGQLKSRISYIDGREHGVWEAFFEDGKRSSVGQFYNGSKFGIWKYYYPNGDIKTYANYDSGLIIDY